MKKEYEAILKEFDSYKGVRTVETWNAIREDCKIKFSQQAISWLDGSGHITSWLKSN